MTKIVIGGNAFVANISRATRSMKNFSLDTLERCVALCQKIT